MVSIYTLQNPLYNTVFGLLSAPLRFGSGFLDRSAPQWTQLDKNPFISWYGAKKLMERKEGTIYHGVNKRKWDQVFILNMWLRNIIDII